MKQNELGKQGLVNNERSESTCPTEHLAGKEYMPDYIQLEVAPAIEQWDL